MIPESRHKRFLQFPLSTRLGHFASDLARIASFANSKSAPVIESVIEESRAFIEWTAPDLLPDRVDDAARLVDIQRGLTRWKFVWDKIQNEPDEWKKLSEQARAWSDEVLAMSGLLNEE